MSTNQKVITLQNLFNSGFLSIGSCNICTKYKLDNLEKILKFYQKHGSFSKLLGCGKKHQLELLELCNMEGLLSITEQTLDEKLNTIPKISLNDIYETEYMSLRTFNICNKNGLTSLDKIISYYISGVSFLSLAGGGKVLERELISICQKYNFTEKYITVRKSETSSNIINDLPIDKRMMVNQKVKTIIPSLSVRAQNGLKSLSKSEHEITEKIFAPGFNFKMIQNIGEKTCIELGVFKAGVWDFVKLINRTETENLFMENLKLLLELDTTNFEPKFKNVFFSNGKIKLFTLLKGLIDTDYIFKNKRNAVFFETYCNSNNNSTKYLEDKLELSRERIRQIKEDIELKFESYFRVITDLSIDSFADYELDAINSFWVVDNSIVEKINTLENVNFKPYFYARIFNLLLDNDFIILGGDKALPKKQGHAGKKYLHDCYMIRRRLTDVFNFNEFIIEVNSRVTQEINETYSVHFEAFLYDFFILKDQYHLYLDEVKNICKKIVVNEIGKIINEDGWIVFERNKRKYLVEYIVQILEEHGNPMTLEEAFKSIQIRFPDVEVAEQTIRSIIHRDKNNFICFGRSSTYGLKKWEVENENIKGGSIRDMVEEFLKNSITPRHISEIVNWVKKYRDTNERSVLTNIEIETNNRFQFFDGGNIGLKGKTYGLEIFNYKKIVGTHFNKFELLKLNGLDFEVVIEKYVKKYGYSDLQVRHILKRKIEEGLITLTDDNKIKIF